MRLHKKLASALLAGLLALGLTACPEDTEDPLQDGGGTGTEEPADDPLATPEDEATP